MTDSVFLNSYIKFKAVCFQERKLHIKMKYPSFVLLILKLQRFSKKKSFYRSANFRLNEHPVLLTHLYLFFVHLPPSIDIFLYEALQQDSLCSITYCVSLGSVLHSLPCSSAVNGNYFATRGLKFNRYGPTSEV
jgi:hypothetical protein